ncbi:MAG: hypothetical protein IT280_05230 [Ignavibacteria bacterium]|nr:hypothetical protein [Ignavibacteria bacterium]
MYNELDYNEELISAIDAYRHFISGSKYISNRYKTLCAGFVNNVSRLFKFKQNKTEEQLFYAEKEIINTAGSLYYDWLIEKLNQLRN